MKIKRCVELVAPDKLFSYGDKPQAETITGDIVRCECCNGEGGKYINSYCTDFDFSKNNGDGYYVACRMCKGSGNIQPFVSVVWKSAGEIKEVFKTPII